MQSQAFTKLSGAYLNQPTNQKNAIQFLQVSNLKHFSHHSKINQTHTDGDGRGHANHTPAVIHTNWVKLNQKPGHFLCFFNPSKVAPLCISWRLLVDLNLKLPWRPLGEQMLFALLFSQVCIFCCDLKMEYKTWQVWTLNKAIFQSHFLLLQTTMGKTRSR